MCQSSEASPLLDVIRIERWLPCCQREQPLPKADNKVSAELFPQPRQPTKDQFLLKFVYNISVCDLRILL
jgi:hypothetical protein